MRNSETHPDEDFAEYLATNFASFITYGRLSKCFATGFAKGVARCCAPRRPSYISIFTATLVFAALHDLKAELHHLTRVQTDRPWLAGALTTGSSACRFAGARDFARRFCQDRASITLRRRILATRDLLGTMGW